jgi:hypothetical protein
MDPQQYHTLNKAHVCHPAPDFKCNSVLAE